MMRWLRAAFAVLLFVVPVASAHADGNLIPNGGAEQAATATRPVGWQSSQWGTSQATATYVTGDAAEGSRFLRIDMMAHTGTRADGDAKWYFDAVPVTAGETYLFTDRVRAGVTTYMTAAFTKADGSMAYQEFATVRPAAGWSLVSGVFTVPQGVVKATVFHLIADPGRLDIDDCSFTVAPPVNLVKNPSFEDADPTRPGEPASWQHEALPGTTATFTWWNTGHTGNRSAKVTVTRVTRVIQQHVAPRKVSQTLAGDAKYFFPPVGVKETERYFFEAYYKSSVPTHIVALVNMADGGFKVLMQPDAPASPSVWSRYARWITMPLGAAKATVVQVVYTPGWLATDDYMFIQQPAVGFRRSIVTHTYDDGYASQYEAFKQLLAHGRQATFFIISGAVGDGEYADWAMIAEMKAAGMEIGAHTVSHPHLPTLNAKRLYYELFQCLMTLSMKGLGPVLNFAPPYSETNPQVDEVIRKLYLSSRLTLPGWNSKDGFDPYKIVAMEVHQDTTLEEVRGWMEVAARHRLWLVLVFHGIDRSGDFYSVTPEMHAAILDLEQQYQVGFLTEQQALDEIRPQLGQR